ncbi:MAG: formate--tetrahydrofolate ligase [Deltaproteobacteria bacterium]|nr:formate--tetrahydrofolate ligase [Deltaproteobacteria bacterium]MBW2398552.1 formate--tetrahydrofolate ligase [Deltaproteobacteria bacterium]
MLSDVEIAHAAQPQPIAEIGSKLGLAERDLHPYGHDVAKVDLSVLERPRVRQLKPRLVLVSAITPTPAGEGKTTTSIGLADALARVGESVCLALREPSLGPCMGVKGGAAGGGYSQVIPMERINLHFTGDFHAITSANNLLAAMLDNHLHQGNELDIDPRRILWRRVIDLNDRALRHVVVGLGGTTHGIPREGGFDITAASEVMAMLCLANDADDLRDRLNRTLVAFDRRGAPVTAKQLGASGAMLALLHEALRPNLVQTLEGTPAFVHGGPFANIAHGCNSVIATRLALHTADWCITEAGFGFDLGAEKFFDIKCQSAGLDTAAVVLVATVRALKMHGGHKRSELGKTDPEAVRRGLPNLEKHLESIHCFGERPVVAINRFASDSEEELSVIRGRCEALGVPVALTDHHARGGAGAEELARTLIAHAETSSTPFSPLYDWNDPVEAKIEVVARSMYGAASVGYSKAARQDLRSIEELGYAGLPVCIAKIPGSLSDDTKLRGRPRDFEINVRGVQVNAGAGFLVVLTGDIMRMPGLPRRPLAESIDVRDGTIVGLT